MLTVRVRDLALAVDAPPQALRQSVCRRLKLSPEEIGSLKVARRALDARHRPPRYVYAVDIGVPEARGQSLVLAGKAELIARTERVRWHLRQAPKGPPPVVVGAGPAGLFAALTLAEGGWPPILIERGRAVEQRARDVSQLYAHGTLDPDSNVCYGEGGAGAFSDGKLHTRVGDARVLRVLEQLIAHGADADILINSRPHLGTDKLIAIIKRIRARLTDLGTTMRFETSLDRPWVRDGKLAGLLLQGGERLDTAIAIVATGHSARTVWQHLQDAGLRLEARPFAVGFRVEHPQALIDRIRYGKAASQMELPAADYRMTHNERRPRHRGVYSFCMCPGGVVVPTPTCPQELCVNGMSHAARSGRYANSALVVSVGPEDFSEAGFTGLYAGVAFQQACEQAAFTAGGGQFVAPAMRLDDFVDSKPSTTVGATSYRRGLAVADLRALYPASVIEPLQRAIRRWSRTMRGFVTREATLIGVETRTASPIRVARGQDLQALGVGGLYPVGEGMGYGGGIVSAAVDGIRAAESILEAHQANKELLAESS